jgi:hypothetical protein
MNHPTTLSEWRKLNRRMILLSWFRLAIWIAIIFFISFISSCQKEKWLKYSYTFSKAPVHTNDFVRFPYIGTSFLQRKDFNDKADLDRRTFTSLNNNPDYVYRIDSSWLEYENCFGCKKDWE